MSVIDRIKQAGSDFGRRVFSPLADRIVSARRVSEADMRDMRLANTIYHRLSRGGALKYVLEDIGRPCPDESKSPVIGYFNPVPSICKFATNAFGGRLGFELKVVDPKADPLAAAVESAISRIWRWSNLDTRSAEVVTANSNQGTVGCRIVYDGDRVYMDFDDVRLIKNVEPDDRGNAETVWLAYTIQKVNDDGSEGDPIQVEEVISKFGFSLLYDGEEQLTPDQQKNVLGICPYVIFAHETSLTSKFGVHAYAGSELAIDGINYALSHLDESTRAHLWPYLFASSPAKAPTKLTFGKSTMLFSQTRENMPQPTLETLVPELDYTAITAYVVQTVDWLREKQPQMILNSLSLLSGVSGETLQQVMKPAEAESLRLRANLESCFVRAVQIALSVGIFHGVFDLGTGTGTKEAAERAYADGEGVEAFRFADRPALPPTVAQKQQQAKADQADAQAKLDVATRLKAIGVPQRSQWKAAGFSNDEITLMESELKNQGSLATDDDFADSADA